MKTQVLHPEVTPEHLGLIPMILAESFNEIDSADTLQDTTALEFAEIVNKHYGFNAVIVDAKHRFRIRDDGQLESISYPEDRPYMPLAKHTHKNFELIQFESAWMWMTDSNYHLGKGSAYVARMD